MARGPVSVRYRVYAHEMSVRTNWVDDEFALLNGAPTFITLLESPSRRRARCAARASAFVDEELLGDDAGGGAEHVSRARLRHARRLSDRRRVASVYEFSVRGKPHYLVNFRERGVWNGPQAAQDLAKVAENDRAILGRRAVRSVLLPQYHRIERKTGSSTGTRRS